MNRRIWTEEEITYLKENVGKKNIKVISKKLKRSENAILCKMKILRISNTKAQTGYLTTYELGKLLKVDPTTIRGWIKKHELKSQKRTTRASKRFYLIHPEDFWVWADNNREKIDFSKIEYQSIVPEPKWVDKERTKEKQVTYKIWTIKEERLLQMMFSEGYSIIDIAGNLGRSKTSVIRKFERLQIAR